MRRDRPPLASPSRSVDEYKQVSRCTADIDTVESKIANIVVQVHQRALDLISSGVTTASGRAATAVTAQSASAAAINHRASVSIQKSVPFAQFGSPVFGFGYCRSGRHSFSRITTGERLERIGIGEHQESIKDEKPILYQQVIQHRNAR